MAVGVLALQGSFNEHIAALRRLGVKGVEIRKPEQLDSVAALIIPSGESTTMAKLAEFHNLYSVRSSKPPIRDPSGSTNSNAPKPRKRVEAETSATLKRARDGSAFARCEECKSSVPVALIDMHSCSLEAKIKMNLEAQVVEKEAEVKKKPAEAKKSSGARKKSETSSDPESESKPKKKLKKAGDPNKPKRPQTAFFLFMADFRVTFKEENPDSKKVSECAKQGGEKWKSMSEEEKKPYMEKAAELKAEFGKRTLESNTTENENDDEIHQPEELCDADA